MRGIFKLGICLWLCAIGLGSAVAAPLVLDDAVPVHDAWPVVRVLPDAGRSLDVQTALSRLSSFKAPDSPHAGMGFREEAMWFHLPVQVADNASGQWILEIDYALLNRIDVFVVRDGGIELLATLGNLQPLHGRPLASRTPAVALALPPGKAVDVLLRVDTRSTMIVPVKFLTPGAFHARANNEFMLQGILLAIGLCLLVLSAQQWLGLRDTVYIKYGALIISHLLFGAHLFGLGALYLWRDNPWLELHVAGLTSLLVSATLALFVEAILRDDLHPRARQALKALAVILVVCSLLFALDLMNNQWLSIVAGVFGLMPALLGLQGAIARVRRGDMIGVYFIAAWTGYFLAGVVLYLTITGRIGVNFWTMHSVQIGATLDMLLFMRIVVLRSAAEHRAAQLAGRERDVMRSLALTDSLTGLVNRRGLNEALARLVPGAAPDHLLAVYMLDLDGFKPVNDLHGHDIGDELLVAIGKRLTASLRSHDIVARVGGDEFVVVAADLKSAKQAVDLGQKLSAQFEAPFDAGNQRCKVGVTIGYALAPEDSTDIATLLKAADTSMYAGKQAGKGKLMRGKLAAA